MLHPTVIEPAFHPPTLMYDNPSTSSSFQVEDFFNLDLLTGNGDAHPSASDLPADPARGRSDDPSSSRASSESHTDSPISSFANLRTPPQSEAIPSFDVSGLGMGMSFDTSAFGGLPPIEEESIFTIGTGSSGDFFKPGTDPLAGLSHSPFDLFAPFDSTLNEASATLSDASVSAVTPASTASSDNSGSFTFSAINPQLFRGPATPTTSSSDSHSENGVDADDDGESSHGLAIAPVKVGGKGKARRGTLQSGGVSKKPVLSGPQSIFGALSSSDGQTISVDRPSGKIYGKGKGPKDKDLDNEDEKDEDLDDWRPSPEEYAKMSSKEKRQLRNKISARNFRIRRKEYIATLEGDIADRDRVIEAIRTELGSTQSENSALRQEVTALKKAILEGRASPMLPPPAPLSPLSPLSSFASLPGSSPSTSSNANANKSGNNSNIIKPNTHKDLPTSPRLGASPFWGGQAGGFGSFGGGVTPVHTAIIPETGASVFSSEDRQKENINPALNVPAQYQPQQQHVLSQVLSQLYGNSSNTDAKNENNWHGSQNAFDAFGFADVNPFTLKTLDAYRMQLWGRMATQVQHAQRMRSTDAAADYPSPHPSPSSNASTALSGLASSLRPQYFASANTRTSKSPTSTSGASRPLGSVLSNKGLPHAHHAHHGLPTPPASPRLGEKDRVTSQQAGRVPHMKEREQAQTHALLATLASQTLLQKLGSVFWEAFSPSPGSSPGPSAPLRAWDTDKVRRVLEGSAVLRVVNIDHPAPTSPPNVVMPSATPGDTLAERMQGLSLDNKLEKREEGNRSEKKGLLARMSCSGCSSSRCDST